MRPVTFYLLLLLAIPERAWAHGESPHKGNPVRGTVTAVSEDTLTLETDDGPTSVTLTIDTKVERGEQDVGRRALASGSRVGVFGTKVPGHGLVAREVVVEANTPHQSSHGDGHQRHKH